MKSTYMPLLMQYDILYIHDVLGSLFIKYNNTCFSTTVCCNSFDLIISLTDATLS